MTTVTETVDIEAPTERVFSYVDDMRNVGWHMTDRPVEPLRPMLGNAKRSLELCANAHAVEHRS